MLKKTINYVDYDGNEREEDWYFNLNRAEVFELESSVNGGFDGLINKVVQDQDGKEIMRIFKEIILMSVGKKSFDGRTFEKSEEISNEFLHTEAYSELFMELVTDAEKAADFIKAVLPSEESLEKAASAAEKNSKDEIKAIPSVAG